MDDLLDLEDVLKIGPSSYRDAFISEEEDLEEVDYREQGRVPVARDIETGELVWLPFNNRTRILLCAKSREGKTLIGKTYLSKIVDLGGKVFCGSDIKNDFQSFDYKSGVSQELVDSTQGLLKPEKPKIKDRDFKKDFAKTLGIPYFMKDFYLDSDGKPRNIGSLFTINFSDISKNDFKGLIGLDDWRSESQRDTMNDILSTVEISDLTWEYLFRRIDEEATEKSGEKLKRKLRPYSNENVVGSKGESLDAVMDFDYSNLVSLGLVGIDDAEDSRVEFYSALAHRAFFKKCRSGDLPSPRVLFNDEAHEILPSDRSTLVKDEIALLFSRKAGQIGVSTVLSSQEPRKIPSEGDNSPHDFVKDTTHAFVGRGLNWKGYTTVFKVFRFYDANNTQPLRDLTNRLEQYQFLYLDQGMESVEDVRIVEALAPLVSHPG